MYLNSVLGYNWIMYIEANLSKKTNCNLYVLSESFKHMSFRLYFHGTASIFSSYTPCTHCENLIVP